MGRVNEIWHSYSGVERRNIAIYIAGIMMYKFGLEFFNGSITTLATDRFKSAATFTKLGAAQGVNQAAQCVGAILIAPLIKKWPTRSVLAGAIFFFGIMTAILLIVDAGTGGKIKPAGAKTPVYGDWNPNLIFVIWTLSGICYGMVELIRRVIPADIVGGDVSKLRRMDAVVHIFYEVAGTSGAFSSSSAITRFGNNYSFFMTPVFFASAGAIWIFISTLNFKSSKVIQEELEQSGLAEVDKKRSSSNYLVQVGYGAVAFGESIYVGSKIVFLNRRFIWLLPSYAIALYMHRFLEGSLAPAFAKRVLGTSAWSQIIVGGSNFGELLGAFAVLILSDVVTTPLPWLRLDALLLNIVWILPHFSTRATNDVTWAWKIAGCFIPISWGWAAGDVSLAAYIQSSLSSDPKFKHANVSALGAVMAFLYSTYIVLNAVFSSVLGKVFDKDFTKNGNIIYSLKMVGGVHFSVACGIILLSTFIPKGAFAINPKSLGPVGTPESRNETSDSEDGEDFKKTNTTDLETLEKSRS
ncbi:hypothetical protein CVT25_008434 [Psilocybe cyanescens]|uniref:Major facilitator superfamily (MFS) profile domain-containing protein n=1 Tax=Psilocybe cyanescens TaxID=93625 RepID=A0A409WUT0_PSICY|nr:hypothetical protein CVT25_008434 [Psilocybe cyanescens]